MFLAVAGPLLLFLSLLFACVAKKKTPGPGKPPRTPVAETTVSHQMTVSPAQEVTATEKTAPKSENMPKTAATAEITKENTHRSNGQRTDDYLEQLFNDLGQPSTPALNATQGSDDNMHLKRKVSDSRKRDKSQETAREMSKPRK